MVSLQKNRVIWFVFLLYFMQPAVFQKQVEAEEVPLKVVEETVEEILDILKNKECADSVKREEREKLIKEAVDKRFDYWEMSRQTLARHWKVRTPEEQKQFVTLFSKLLEKTYISKVESYCNEEVIYKDQLIKGNRAMVRTFIVKPDKEISIIYKLKNKQGKWMVYGVVIEGVSLIRNYRTQFEGIIKKEEYAGLLKRLEEKIEKEQIS